MRRQLAVVIVAMVTVAAAAHAGPRDRNYLANPGFERTEGDRATAWQPAALGYELAMGAGRGGGNCLHFRSDDPTLKFGALQVIELDPPIAHPIVVSGWSKCRDASGIDYCIWLDVHYDDGTPLWGQRASFTRGTHDWEHAQFAFTPARPVARIEAFVLFRQMTGEAWVDDVHVGLAPFGFERLRAVGGLTGPGSAELSAAVNMPARWRVELVRDGMVVAARTGSGRTQRVSFAGGGAAWGGSGAGARGGHR